MSKQQKDPPCKVCGKTTGHECGRLVCGNRKQETAGPPPGHRYTDGTVPMRRSPGDGLGRA